MAVFGECVVLAEPGVLPVVLIGAHDVVDLLHQHSMLSRAIVGLRTGQMALNEDAEFHETPTFHCDLDAAR
jgi:hypothetical protein